LQSIAKSVAKHLRAKTSTACPLDPSQRKEEERKRDRNLVGGGEGGRL